MAAMTTVLKAIITADASQMKTQLAAAEGSLKSFGSKASATGKKLTKNVTLPMGLVAGASIKMASDFEASMSKIESLVGLSAKEVEGFTEDVKNLSGETAQAPKDLADAMFFITSAGIRGAAATETLEAAAKAAAVGLGETATIADLATSALNAYGEENLSATSATDVMVAAVREGKLEASELAGSMGRVLPLASAMGVNFNEVGAAFAALSRTGTNAAEAATQVRGILASLLRPTKQSEEALTSMGLSSAELRAQLKEKGLLSVLKTLSVEFDGQSEKAAAVFGNIRALSGVMDLLGKNSASTEAIFANMTDTTGALDDAFAVTSETTAFKLQQAMADMKMAFVKIGEVLIPVIVPIIEKLAGVISTVADGFSKLTGPVKTATIAFIGLAAASGPALTILGGGSKMLGGLIPAFKKTGDAVGAAKGKGLLGRMGGLLNVVKAHPVAFGAAAVAGVTLGVVMGRMRKRAQEARNRMNMLKQEFIDAGDPTATMTDRVRELAAKLNDVEKSAKDSTTEMLSFQGSSVLTSELVKRKVSSEFHELGLEMGTLIPLVKGGTDEFHKLGDQTKHLVRDEERFIEKLKTADASILGVTYRLAEQVEAGELSTKQAREIMIAIDEAADAFDDYNKILEKNAKEYLTSDQGILDVVGSLGLLGSEILETADETGNYLEAQEKIDLALRTTDDAVNGGIGAWLGYGDVVREIPIIEEEVIISEKELEEQQKALEEKLALTEERVQAVRDQFDGLVASLRDTIGEAYEFDEAQIAVEQSMLNLLDTLEKQNDESLTALEQEKALVDASKLYATELANVAEAMAGMSIAEINDEFAEQQAFLESIKDSMPEDEYARLSGLLSQIHTDALAMHGLEIATDLKMSVVYTDSMLEFLDLMNSFASMQEFGAMIAGGVGTGSGTANYSALAQVYGLPAFASGGIVQRPTLGLIGEAGPEAVIPLNQMGSMGGTNVTVNVSGSVLTEYDLAETIQNQLIRIKGRNASLEFG
jgi:TP901 family phage tail tape measure protein